MLLYTTPTCKKLVFTFHIHYDEVCRLNMKEEWIENINKYTESKHFYDFRKIERKLFREGNAVNLDSNLNSTP